MWTYHSHRLLEGDEGPFAVSALAQSQITNSCYLQHFSILDCYANRCNRYACPLCSKSVCDISKVWEKFDEDIAATPMPEPYQNKMVCDLNILLYFTYSVLLCIFMRAESPAD